MNDIGQIIAIVAFYSAFLMGLTYQAAIESGRDFGKAMICAEIDWHSPTCEDIKQKRLQP